MMKNIQQVKAFAKLNLTLDVLGKRDDGFHELITIMQAIDLYDEISIEFTSKKAVSVAADFELPEGSVAFNAANEYIQRTGSGGANINIKGRIPPMAGLGGSSADGAAVLRAMQRHYGLYCGRVYYKVAIAYVIGAMPNKNRHVKLPEPAGERGFRPVGALHIAAPVFQYACKPAHGAAAYTDKMYSFMLVYVGHRILPSSHPEPLL